MVSTSPRIRSPPVARGSQDFLICFCAHNSQGLTHRAFFFSLSISTFPLVTQLTASRRVRQPLVAVPAGAAAVPAPAQPAGREPAAALLREPALPGSTQAGQLWGEPGVPWRLQSGADCLRGREVAAGASAPGEHRRERPLLAPPQSGTVSQLCSFFELDKWFLNNYIGASLR